MDSQAEQLFEQAKTAFKSLVRAERNAVLARESYRRYDMRGVHAQSYERGRLEALVDLFPELGPFNAEALIDEVCRAADAKWRHGHAVGLLVDAAAERHLSDLEPMTREDAA